MLAQGLLTGFGSCFLYLPAIAIIPQYFDKNKAIANGIAASGSGLGQLKSYHGLSHTDLIQEVLYIQLPSDKCFKGCPLVGRSAS